MNLATYIRKHEEPLKPEEFSHLDALSLCWATYFDYSGIEFPIAVKTLALQPFAWQLEERNQTFVPNNTANFMDAFLHSPRYQDVVILECKEVRDEDAKVQFFAFLFALGERLFIAFEGTDTTFLGWQEDFMLTYRDGIGSYPHALAYVEDVLSRYEGSVDLMGHSKGGNVAAYVLSQLTDDSRIGKVYSYEGPGFYREDIFEGKRERLAKVEKYIPQCAIVGVILSSYANARIVRSKDFVIFQHNAIEWVIKGNDFVYAKKRTATSRTIEASVNSWIRGLSVEDKERFTELFFQTFSKLGIHDFRAFLSNIFVKFPELHKAYSCLDKEDKKLFRKVFGVLFKTVAWNIFTPSWIKDAQKKKPLKG